MISVKKYMTAFAQEKQQLLANKVEVEARNKQMITTIVTSALIVFLCLLTVSFVSQVYVLLRTPYLIMVFLLVILLILSLINSTAIKALPLYYTAFSIFVAYCIYTSRYITPGYTGIVILALLFIMPLLIMDTSIRIIIIEIIAAIVYIALVAPHKIGVLSLDEAVNVSLFTIMALFISRHLMRVRVENLDLIRISKLRESTDALTGLFNRYKLFETLGKIEQLSTHEYIAVAMIDVDNFKMLNDKQGHIAGDECLVKISACLKEASQKYPLSFYRYGGEEFLALFQHSDISPIDICAEINKQIENLKIPNKVGSSDYITCSIGLVYVDTTNTQNFEKWIGHADLALYQSKRSGRNTTTIFTHDLQMASNISSGNAFCKPG